MDHQQFKETSLTNIKANHYDHEKELNHQTIQLTHKIEPPEDHNDDDLLDTNSIFAKKKRKKLMVQRIVYMAIMNAAIPIGLYYILKSYVPPVWALVLSSIPTILSVIVQAIFMR